MHVTKKNQRGFGLLDWAVAVPGFHRNAMESSPGVWNKAVSRPCLYYWVVKEQHLELGLSGGQSAATNTLTTRPYPSRLLAIQYCSTGHSWDGKAVACIRTLYLGDCATPGEGRAEAAQAHGSRQGEQKIATAVGAIPAAAAQPSRRSAP